MQVVHINISIYKGGAAKACFRLHEALINSDVQSNILTVKDSAHNVFPIVTNLYLKFIYAFNFLLELSIIKLLIKKNTVPFSFGFVGVNFLNHELIRKADIIHLHWVNHGMLNASIINKIKKIKKPIVWTLHDSWVSTGGCHVKAGCMNYISNSCKNCPVLNTNTTQFLPLYFYKQKQKLFANNNIQLVTPSNWLKNEIAKSPITSKTPCVNIPNTLNTNIYKPESKSENTKEFKILIGYMKINASGHKGFQYAIKAIELFIEKNKHLKITVSVFGCNKNDLQFMPQLNLNILGFINDEKKMASSYAQADVYVAPYLEDNFPNTVLESLSCGTPVVAFDAGGVPQLIKHLSHGYLSKVKDANDLYEGLNWVYKSNKTLLSENARNYVLDNFSNKHVANKHIELYKSLLKQELDSRFFLKKNTYI